MLYQGVSDHPFSCRYISWCYTRIIRVIQLAKTTKQSQGFYCGLRAEGSKSKMKPIGLFLQQGLEKILGDLLDLLFLAEAQFGGFLCEAGAGPLQVKVSSSTICLQLSVLHKSVNEPVHLGSITRRLG